MGDPVAFQVVDHGTLEYRVVVAVVERARAGEEIEISATVLVVQAASSCPVERCRPAPAITPYLGFKCENVQNPPVGSPMMSRCRLVWAEADTGAWAGAKGPIRNSSSVLCSSGNCAEWNSCD